jgi:hypothetical protein
MRNEGQEHEQFGKKPPGDTILVKTLAILFVIGIYVIIFLKIMILK